MKEFLWSDFLNSKFYINCQTETEAKELFRDAMQYGVMWKDGTELSKLTCFSDWREQTCYRISHLRMSYTGIYSLGLGNNSLPIFKYSDIKLVDKYSTSNDTAESNYFEIIGNMLRTFGIDSVEKFLSCSAYFYRCLDEKYPHNGHIGFAKYCELCLKSMISGDSNEK